MQSAQVFFQSLTKYKTEISGSSYIDVNYTYSPTDELKGLFYGDAPNYQTTAVPPSTQGMTIEQSGKDSYKIQNVQTFIIEASQEVSARLELSNIRLQLNLTQNNNENRVIFKNIVFRDYKASVTPVVETLFDKLQGQGLRNINIQFVNCQFENIESPIFGTSVFDVLNVYFLQCKFSNINIVQNPFMRFKEAQRQTYDFLTMDKLALFMLQQGDGIVTTTTETFRLELCDFENIRGDVISSAFATNSVRYNRFRNVMGSVFSSLDMPTTLKANIENNLFQDCANNDIISNQAAPSLGTNFNVSNNTILSGYTSGFCLPMQKKLYDVHLPAGYSFDRDQTYFAVKFTGRIRKVYVKTLQQPQANSGEDAKEQIYEIDLSTRFQQGSSNPPPVTQNKLFVLSFGTAVSVTDPDAIVEQLNFNLPYQKYSQIEPFFVFETQRSQDFIHYVKFKYLSQSSAPQEITFQQRITGVNQRAVSASELQGGYEIFDIPSISPQDGSITVGPVTNYVWVYSRQDTKQFYLGHSNRKFFIHVIIDPTLFTGAEFFFYDETSAALLPIVIPDEQIRRIKSDGVRDLVLYNDDLSDKLHVLDQTLMNQRYEVIDINVKVSTDVTLNYFQFAVKELFVVSSMSENDSGDLKKEYFINSRVGNSFRSYCVNIRNKYLNAQLLDVGIYVMQNRFIDSPYSVKCELSEAYSPYAKVQNNVFARRNKKQNYQYIQVYSVVLSVRSTQLFTSNLQRNVCDVSTTSANTEANFAVYQTTNTVVFLETSAFGSYSNLFLSAQQSNYRTDDIINGLVTRQCNYPLLTLQATLDSYLGEATFSPPDVNAQFKVKTSQPDGFWSNTFGQFVVFNQGNFIVKNAAFKGITTVTLANDTMIFQQTTTGANPYFKLNYLHDDEPLLDNATVQSVGTSQSTPISIQADTVYEINPLCAYLTLQNQTNATSCAFLQALGTVTAPQALQHRGNITNMNLWLTGIALSLQGNVTDANLYISASQSVMPIYGSTTPQQFTIAPALATSPIIFSNATITLFDSSVSFSNCIFNNCTFHLNQTSEIFLQDCVVNCDVDWIKPVKGQVCQQGGASIRIYDSELSKINAVQNPSTPQVFDNTLVGQQHSNQFQAISKRLTSYFTIGGSCACGDGLDKFEQVFVLSQNTAKLRPPTQTLPMYLRIKKGDGTVLSPDDIKRVRLSLIVKDHNYEYQEQNVILNLDANNSFGTLITQTKNLNIIWLKSVTLEYNRDTATRMDRLLTELKVIFIQDLIVQNEILSMSFVPQSSIGQTVVIMNPLTQLKLNNLIDDMKPFYLSGSVTAEVDLLYLYPDANQATDIPFVQTPNLVIEVQRVVAGVLQPIELMVIKPDATQANYTRPSQPSSVGGARIGKRTITYDFSAITDNKFITADQLQVSAPILGQQFYTYTNINKRVVQPILINKIYFTSLNEQLTIFQTIKTQTLRFKLRNDQYVIYQNNQCQSKQRRYGGGVSNFVKNVGESIICFNNIYGNVGLELLQLQQRGSVNTSTVKVRCNNFITLYQNEIGGKVKQIDTDSVLVNNDALVNGGSGLMTISGNQVVILVEINQNKRDDVPQYNNSEAWRQNPLMPKIPFDPYISRYDNTRTVFGNTDLLPKTVAYQYLNEALNLNYDDISQNLIYYTDLQGGAALYYRTGDYVFIQYGLASGSNSGSGGDDDTTQCGTCVPCYGKYCKDDEGCACGNNNGGGSGGDDVDPGSGKYTLNFSHMLFEQASLLSDIQASYILRLYPGLLSGTNKSLYVFDFYVLTARVPQQILNGVIVCKNVAQANNMVANDFLFANPNGALQERSGATIQITQSLVSPKFKQEYYVRNITDLNTIIRANTYTDGSGGTTTNPFDSKCAKIVVDNLQAYPSSKVVQVNLIQTDVSLTRKINATAIDDVNQYMIKIRSQPGVFKELDGLYVLKKSVFVYSSQPIADVVNYQVDITKETIFDNLQLTFDYTGTNFSDKFIVFSNVTFRGQLIIDALLEQRVRVYFYRCRFMNCKLTYNKRTIKTMANGVQSVATTLGTGYNGTVADLKLCPEIVLDSSFIYQAQATSKQQGDTYALISHNNEDIKSLIFTFNGFLKVSNSYLHLNDEVAYDFKLWSHTALSASTQVDQEYQELIFKCNEFYQNSKQSLVFEDYVCNVSVEQNTFRQNEKQLDNISGGTIDSRVKYVTDQALNLYNTIYPVVYKPDTTEMATDPSYYPHQSFQQKLEMKFLLPPTAAFGFAATASRDNYVIIKIIDNILEPSNQLFVYLNQSDGSVVSRAIPISNSQSHVYYVVVSDSANPNVNIQPAPGENAITIFNQYDQLSTVSSISVFNLGTRFIAKTKYQIASVTFSSGDATLVNQPAIDAFYTNLGITNATSGAVTLATLTSFKWSYDDSAFRWMLYESGRFPYDYTIQNNCFLIELYKYTHSSTDGVINFKIDYMDSTRKTFALQDLTDAFAAADVGPFWVMFGDNPTVERAVELGFPSSLDPNTYLKMQAITAGGIDNVGLMNRILAIYIDNKSMSTNIESDQLMLPDFSLARMTIDSTPDDKYTIIYKAGGDGTDPDDLDTKYEEIRMLQTAMVPAPAIARNFTIQRNIFKNHVVGIYSGIQYPCAVVAYKQIHNFFINALQFNFFFDNFAANQNVNFSALFANNVRISKDDIVAGLYFEITDEDSEGTFTYDEYKNTQNKEAYINKIHMGTVPYNVKTYYSIQEALQALPQSLNTGNAKAQYVVVQHTETLPDNTTRTIHRVITFIQQGYDIEKAKNSTQNTRNIYLYDPHRERIIQAKYILEGIMPASGFMCVLFNCLIPEKIQDQVKQYIDILSFKLFQREQPLTIPMMIKTTICLKGYIIPVNSILTIYPVDQFVVLNDQTVCQKYVQYVDSVQVLNVDIENVPQDEVQLPFDKLMQITNYENNIIRILKGVPDVQGSWSWVPFQNLLQRTGQQILGQGVNYDIVYEESKCFLLTCKEDLDLLGTLDANNTLTNEIANAVLITNGNTNLFENLLFTQSFVFRGQCKFTNCQFTNLAKPYQRIDTQDQKSDVKANIVPDNQLLIPTGTSYFNNCSFTNCQLNDITLIDVGMNNTLLVFNNCTFDSCAMQDLIKSNRVFIHNSLFKNTQGNSVHIDGTYDHVLYERNSTVKSELADNYFLNDVGNANEQITKIYYIDRDDNRDKNNIVNDPNSQNNYLQPISASALPIHQKNWLFLVQNQQIVDIPEVLPQDISQVPANFFWIKVTLPRDQNVSQPFGVKLLDSDNNVIAQASLTNLPVGNQRYDESLIIVFGTKDQYYYQESFNGVWRSIPNVFSQAPSVIGDQQSAIVISNRKYRISSNKPEIDPQGAGAFMKIHSAAKIQYDNIENVTLTSYGWHYDTLRTEYRQREYIYGKEPYGVDYVPSIRYLSNISTQWVGIMTTEGFQFSSQNLKMKPIVSTPNLSALAYYVSFSTVPLPGGSGFYPFPQMDGVLTIEHPTNPSLNIVKTISIQTEIVNKTTLVFVPALLPLPNYDTYFTGANTVYVPFTQPTFTPKNVTLVFSRQFQGSVVYEFLLIDSGYLFNIDPTLGTIGKQTYIYQYQDDGRDPKFQNTDILVTNKHNYTGNTNKIIIKSSIFTDRYILGIENTLSTGANGDYVFELENITYTNENSSDIQQLAENIVLVDTVQKYGLLTRLVINNTQMKPGDYPKALTDLFDVQPTVDDINTDFDDQQGNTIYLRPLTAYAQDGNNGNKYRVTVYDPLNFFSTRLAFVISAVTGSIANLQTLANDYALDDNLYFTAIQTNLNGVSAYFDFKVNLQQGQSLTILDNLGQEYVLDDVQNSVQLRCHDPSDPLSQRIYSIAIIALEGVRYQMSSQGNGNQLQLMNGVSGGTGAGGNIVVPNGGDDDTVKRSAPRREKAKKSARKPNQGDMLISQGVNQDGTADVQLDDLDKLISQGLGLDGADDNQDDDDDANNSVSYRAKDVDIEYDDNGHIISPIQRVFYGLIPTDVKQLAIYQDKEQLAEIIKQRGQASQERRRFLNEFEQLKNQSISQVFSIQSENVKLNKDLLQQKQDLENNKETLRQEYQDRLDAMQEEQNKKLRELEKLGGLNIQSQKEQLQQQYDAMFKDLQTQKEQHAQSLKKKEQLAEKEILNKKKELEASLKKIKDSIVKQQEDEKKRQEDERAKYAREFKELQDYIQMKDSKTQELKNLESSIVNNQLTLSQQGAILGEQDATQKQNLTLAGVVDDQAKKIKLYEAKIQEVSDNNVALHKKKHDALRLVKEREDELQRQQQALIEYEKEILALKKALVANASAVSVNAAIAPPNAPLSPITPTLAPQPIIMQDIDLQDQGDEQVKRAGFFGNILDDASLLGDSIFMEKDKMEAFVNEQRKQLTTVQGAAQGVTQGVVQGAKKESLNLGKLFQNMNNMKLSQLRRK